MEPLVEDVAWKYKNVSHNGTSYLILKILVQCVSINFRNILKKFQLKAFCYSSLTQRNVFGFFLGLRILKGSATPKDIKKVLFSFL